MRFIIRFWLQFIHRKERWLSVYGDRDRIKCNGLGLLDLCKHARYVSAYEKLLGQVKQFAEYAAAAAATADQEVCGTHQKYYTHE